MTFSVKIKNSHNDVNWGFVKTFKNIDEVQQVKSLCKNAFWGPTAMFIPVRTHNLKNFAEDFFIPCVTMSAVKVDSLCFDKIFIRCVELIADLATLPFRAITVIPRAIYNCMYPKNKDPFYQYLKAQGLSKDPLLKNDFVYVGFEWAETSNGKTKQFNKEFSTGFIALPKMRDFIPGSFTSTSITPHLTTG